MPIYEYVCAGCGHKFETLTTLSGAHKTQECPSCGKLKGERVLSVSCVGSSSTAGSGGFSVGGGSCGPRGFG